MTRKEIIEKIEFLKILLKLREESDWRGFNKKEKEEYLNDVLDLLNELLDLLNENENE